MNVNRLQPATPPQVKRVSKDAEDKDAEFLALRLLNKRGRVRLSSQPHKLGNLPGRGILFAIANSIGCFAAAICNESGQHSIIVSGLVELRNAFTSSDSDSEIPFTPRRTVNLPAQPNIVCFASNDSRLLVGFVEGSIAVYDASVLSTAGSGDLQPVHVLPSSTGTAPREIAPNPGDIPDLVAILYEPGGNPDSPRVVLLDVQKQQTVGGWTLGSTEGTVPTALSWSAKGKQLAIGMQGGEIATYAPGDTSTPKSTIPRPESVQGSVISTSWLSNPDFHCIYAQPATPVTAESEQLHVLVSWDAKTATSSEVKLASPYLPVPGLRPPGAFVTVLRQWEPSKFLLFIGDGTSSDIGLIGCTTDDSGRESWANYSLEENSTPAVPLDQEMNDTVLVGLSLDLTATESYTFKTASGEDSVLPPPPVMYAYASDGTIVGWHLLNTLGKPYPGMVNTSAQSNVTDSMEMSAEMDTKATDSAPAQPSAFAQAASTQPSAFAQAAAPQPSAAQPNQPTSAFGQAGSTSAFGQPNQASAFGQTSSTPAFGQSAFGQPSAFGKPSAFGAAPTGSAFGSSSAPGGGFGAFANAGPAKFGQSAFSAGSSSQPVAPPPITTTTSITMASEEDPMSADVSTDGGLGGLGLGGGHPSEDSEKVKSGGIFGSLSSTPAKPESTTPAFGSTSAFGSAIKPASGFGAFGNISTTPSPFGGTFGASSSGAGGSSANSKPSPAFGSSGFGSAPVTTTPSGSGFGQSGFGSKPAFGQSAFGQSAFGSSSTPKSAFASSTTSASSGGGFAAFSGGTSAFGAAAQSGNSVFGKSTQSSAAETKSAEESTKSAPEPAPKAETKPETSAPVSSPPAETSVFGGGAAPVTPRRPAPAFGGPSTPPSSGEESPAATPTPVFAAKSSSPGPTTGAFANITSSPLGFGKLSAGHGAFGASTTPSSSPFYNPPKTQGVSAFGGTPPTPATPPSGSSKPVFGASSAFGAAASPSPSKEPAFGSPSPFGKSAFGTPTVKSAFAPIGSSSSANTSAFRNFAGSGGFGAAASGEKKSFSELLKAEKDKKDAAASSSAAKTPTSVFSKPSTPTAEASSSTDVPERVSVFHIPLKESGAARDSKQAAHDEEEETSEPGEEQLGHPDDDDDAISFISEPLDDDSEERDAEEADEEEEEEEEGEDADDEDDLEEVPIEDRPREGLALPGTAGVTVNMPPTIHLTDASPPSTTAPLKGDETTTPPGSPDKQPAAGPSKPPSTPSPFGAGLGRPSTRPTRSSPLANAPISGDDESDEDKTEKLPPAKAPAVPAKGPSPTVKSEPSKSPSLAPTASRPKTPPPLSAFAPPKPSPFTLAPSTLGTQSPAIAAPAPAKVGSLFGTSTSTSPEAKPGTPPLPGTPSLFAKPPATATAAAQSSTPAQPQSSFFSSPPGTLFGQNPGPPSIPRRDSGTPPQAPAGSPPILPGGGLFGQKPPAAMPMPSVPSSGLFGQRPPSQPQGAASTPPGGFLAQTPPSGTFTVPSSGIFGQKPPAAPPTPSVAGPAFGRPATPSQQANQDVSAAQVAPGLVPDVVREYEDGMQKETANLIISVARELGQTKTMAMNYHEKHKELEAFSANVSSLADSIKKLRAEFGKLKGWNGKYRAALAQLDSALLKVRMRKEEIERFSKASTDAEFAKMMKSRTLGPEHLEIQTQLRRGIRILRDRIQKLEDTLQESKKRLNQLRTGKAGIKAPSLDVISRTYKNIDIAIASQMEDVSKLTARMSKLDLKSLPDQRLNFKGKRASSVAPDVAAATAATLNAERSAQRLKGALLKARRAPLMNTQALSAPPPQMNDAPVAEKQWNPPRHLPMNLPPFQLPGFGPSPSPQGSLTPSHTSSRGPERGKKLHDRAPPLKRSTGAPTETPPSTVSVPEGFSWGPVPKSTNTPVRSLPFAFNLSTSQKKDEEPKVKEEPKEPPSLSGSWVADGFDKK